MKKLIIMRHGKSSWNNFSLNDFERPLNDRGRENALGLGYFLAIRLGLPDMIVTSEAKRSLDTAVIVAQSMGFPKEKIKTDKQLYLASLPTILKSISGLTDNLESCMIVGHNPGLTDLINYFGVRLYNLPTASVACFECRISKWKDISAENIRLMCLQIGKEL